MVQAFLHKIHQLKFISTITFVAKLQKPIKLNFAQFQAEDKLAKNSVAAQTFIGAHSHSSCRESKSGHLAIYDKWITTSSHSHWWQVVPKYLNHTPSDAVHFQWLFSCWDHLKFDFLADDAKALTQVTGIFVLQTTGSTQMLY